MEKTKIWMRIGYLMALKKEDITAIQKGDKERFMEIFNDKNKTVLGGYSYIPNCDDDENENILDAWEFDIPYTKAPTPEDGASVYFVRVGGYLSVSEEDIVELGYIKTKDQYLSKIINTDQFELNGETYPAYVLTEKEDLKEINDDDIYFEINI